MLGSPAPFFTPIKKMAGNAQTTNHRYIFQVHRWSSLFPSFKGLMSDSSLRKVAHNKSADVRPLEARFGGLKLAGVEDLQPIAHSVAKTALQNNKLPTCV